MSDWSSGYVTDLEYTHGFYRELTPSMLSLAMLVAGHRGPTIGSKLNYCELGCGQGFSANLLASANPDIDFYATDFNPVQIVGAQALAAEAGTTNVHFYDQSFDEFLANPELPASFDFINLHGIYTWVAKEHRDTIVEFIRRKLKPGGVVYISYNTLPGWAPSAPMRHLMYLHGQATGGATGARLQPAIEFVDQVINSGAKYFLANTSLGARFDGLKGMNKNYLAHEYFNDAWTLFYHADVAAELDAAKVTYVTSAALLSSVHMINVTPEQQGILAETPPGPFRETLYDYMVNQQFRKDIFSKGTSVISMHASRREWTDLRFVLSSPAGSIPMKVMGSLGEAALQEDVYNPIIQVLAEGPATIGQLIAEPAIRKLGWDKILQALAILTGAGHAQPCLPAKDEAKRARKTREFNAAVCARARDSADLQFLASPVTGGGIAIDRFSQLFILAKQENLHDPSAFVWSVLEERGQRITSGGKTLLEPSENIEHLRTLHENFGNNLPVLKRLGIV